MVVSRGRPLRRRWLLDALDPRCEIVETWTAASAGVVAVIREDMLPAPGWLERALAAAERHPDAIVQGAVRPDPHQVEVLLSAPDLTALGVMPPRAWAPPANLVARRELLANLKGPDPFIFANLKGSGPFTGGAADGARLWAAAREAGVPWVADPQLVVWSSVARPERVRGAAAAVRRHPVLRRHLLLGVFTSRGHLRLALALAGLAAGPRGAPLVLPWLLTRRERDGRGARGRAKALLRLPARTAADARSLAGALAAGARERTLVL